MPIAEYAEISCNEDLCAPNKTALKKSGVSKQEASNKIKELDLSKV